MSDLRKMNLDQITELLESRNQPKFRAKQIYEWLHTHKVSSYNDMTNLPKDLRAWLAEEYPLEEVQVVSRQISSDGTRKYLLKYQDRTLVECVGIVAPKDHDNDFFDDFSDQSAADRLTVCFSTQSGCAMNCSFCATGSLGFAVDLTAEQMIDQLVVVERDFANDPYGEAVIDASSDDAHTSVRPVDSSVRINNVVAMGQGEPFLNYDETLDALREMNSPEGFNIGARHITVSTCGIIDGIYRFAEEPEQFRLAVSLHSAVQSTRDKLMPRLSNQPLKKLKAALLDYNLVKGRRVTLEYMMIANINDKDTDLNALIQFCDGLMCHVNLIPFNEVDCNDYKPSSRKTIKEWASILDDEGIPVSIRYSKGADIAGACGQLARKNLV